MHRIYKVQTEDGRVYIGCTKQTIPHRMAQHKCAGHKFASLPHTVDVICEADTKENGEEIEAFYISKYDSTNPDKGWNRRYGGNYYSFPDRITASFGRNCSGESNPMFGRKQSETAKEKMRQKTKGRKSWCKGMKFSEERKARMRKARAGKGYMKGKDHPMYGKHRSEKTKEKIGTAQSEWQKTHDNPFLGKKHTEKTKRKMREAR